MIFLLTAFGATLWSARAQLQIPVQTYFVPLPEEDLLTKTFTQINDGSAAGGEVGGDVKTLISIAISAGKTVIWYDHWEDGYEEDLNNPMMESSEIWGDGDCSNGFAPNIKGVPKTVCNSPYDDTFSAGDAVLLQNFVGLSRGRDSSQVLFDAGDKIQSSFPVAVTRAAYPEEPGPLMAGGVEVLDVSTWGMEFVAPIGTDTVEFTTNDPFEYTALYVMAHKDDTEVKLNGKHKGVIHQGQTLVLTSIKENDKLVTSKATQVDILAGDIMSQYELRWYSLLPLSSWSDDYYTPVGGVEEEDGIDIIDVSLGDRQTYVWLFNPNSEDIKVKYEYKKKVGFETGTIRVKSESSEITKDPILVGSGGHFYTEDGSKFHAMTQTHVSGTGELFDWGHSLMPAHMLTSQVLVGWGSGCEGNNCNQGGTIAPFKGSRSVVWAMPLERADIHVDYNGDGTVDDVFRAKPLSTLRISDTDNDMTGAFIFATTKGGDPVKMVAAWGQDPSKSTFVDDSALDLGTSIPPLPNLSAGMSSALDEDLNGDGLINPEDTLVYTIRLVNIGQFNLPKNSMTIYDFAEPLLSAGNYVPDSAIYTAYSADETKMYSSVIPGESFPFNDGVLSPVDLLPRGIHEIVFRVQVKSLEDLPEGLESITNRGQVVSNQDTPIELEEERPLIFPPSPPTTASPEDGGKEVTTTDGPEGTQSGGNGGVGGDPHFEMFDGARHSYHGGCDLVMLHSHRFDSGAGLDLNVRTWLKEGYSYVSSAVLRIGSETLELVASGMYYINRRHSEVPPEYLSGHRVYPIHGTRCTYSCIDYSGVHVDLGGGTGVEITVWRRMVYVHMVNPGKKALKGSRGIMGTWGRSGFIGRDEVTIHENFTSFVEEWQVLRKNPMLFHVNRAPQRPHRCQPPIETSSARRLSTTHERRILAENACAHITGPRKEFCLFDVRMTGDVEVAAAPFYESYDHIRNE